LAVIWPLERVIAGAPASKVPTGSLLAGGGCTGWAKAAVATAAPAKAVIHFI